MLNYSDVNYAIASEKNDGNDLEVSSDWNNLNLTVLAVNRSLSDYEVNIVDSLGSEKRDSLYIVIPITIIYVMIFLTGLIGNISTCVVIARNKSMHTATNYYLFSLAISDLLLLISGLPPEMYYIWSHYPYAFGETFCVVQSFAAETSANATVLTITAFTVERYVAICHPFLSHTMSKLSRAVKYVIAIWLLALGLAVPQAIQFGVVYRLHKNGTRIEDSAECSMKTVVLQHAFQMSTLLFFIVPMTVITVLYILIGIKLRSSRMLTVLKRSPSGQGSAHSDCSRGKGCSQRNVIRMLVAVVVAFFICWAPFHAQRLLAVYASQSGGGENDALVPVYTVLTYVSGVFYYLSTTVNPLLYNIMSNKFREAFKAMLSKHCGARMTKSVPRRPTYSSLSRYNRYPGQGHNVKRERQASGSLSVSDETQKLAISEKHPKITTPQMPRSMLSTDNLQGSTILADDSDFTDEKSKHENEIKLPEIARVMENQNNNGNHYPELDGKSRSRGNSDTSQVTVMTTLGKSINEGNNNFRDSFCVDECSIKPHKPKTVNFGILAERLKHGAGGLFAVQPRFGKRYINNSKSESSAIVTTKFQNCPNIDAEAKILNSSLQNLTTDRSFSPFNLGNVNIDIVT